MSEFAVYWEATESDNETARSLGHVSQKYVGGYARKSRKRCLSFESAPPLPTTGACVQQKLYELIADTKSW